ncbi:MAG: prolipoprotein diacylglyceryl transferase [Anaerolineae bacterium]
MNFLPNGVAISIPLPFTVFGQNSLAIYWYGILIVVGAIAGSFLATFEAKRRSQDPDQVWNILLFALVFGVIGARAYHIMSDVAQGDPLGYFSKDTLTNILAAINPRTGGLGIYGAVAGGILGIWIYARYAKLRFWQWVDIAVPGLTLAQAIGRWGNFFNQELYGWPTTLPWGIPIDAQHRLPQFATLPDTTRFHPTFLYESLAMLVVTGILLYIGRRYSGRLKNGDMFLLYGMLYPLVRFFTEMERPDAWLVSGVPAAQIIAVASFVVCGVWFAYRHTGPASQAREAQPVQRQRVRRRAGATSRARIAAANKPAAPDATIDTATPPPDVSHPESEPKG